MDIREYHDLCIILLLLSLSFWWEKNRYNTNTAAVYILYFNIFWIFWPEYVYTFILNILEIINCVPAWNTCFLEYLVEGKGKVKISNLLTSIVMASGFRKWLTTNLHYIFFRAKCNYMRICVYIDLSAYTLWSYIVLGYSQYFITTTITVKMLFDLVPLF